jgi:anaerobic magnesium-protoporphyrin IX monomethyl ester cyclase
MNVLFIHSEQDPFSENRPMETFERMQFGISYISSVLKEAGHRTKLAVLSQKTIPRVDEYVRKFSPGLVCFTSVYTEYHIITQVAARVKKAFPEIFTVIGGPHASLRPEECLEDVFDAVCVGEGEYATLELVEQLESGHYPSGIPNLYIKKPDGKVERNETRPFLEDLESLPFPDREMWLPWVANTYSRPSVLLGRGCPFRCTYCCNHALRRVAEGQYVRLRSPSHIIAELTAMKEDNPYIEHIYLEVETLGVDMEWALELCAKLRDLNSKLEIPIIYGTNLRVTPNVDYNDLFAALKEANFLFLNIGLESGSERLRKEVLKRRYSNRDIEQTVEMARKYGLQLGFYNLIGLPGETKADFRETVRMNRVCQPDWFLLAVFFPYPGTELHETCREMGLLEDGLDTNLERRIPVLDLPGFSKRQVERRRSLFPFFVYRGHKPLSALIWLVVMAKIYSNRRLIELHKRYKRAHFLRNTDEETRALHEAFFHMEEDDTYFSEPDAVCPAGELEGSQP